MDRSIAFLRGINVSGRNRISMAALKSACTALGLSDVRTYLNSGNIAFSADPAEDLRTRIEQMISRVFGITTSVFVISQAELAAVTGQAPAWWGTGRSELYDNLIFVLPPATSAEIMRTLGPPRPELEQVQDNGNVIFWSFQRRQYRQTNWWARTARAPVNASLTIRTAATVRRMLTL